MQDHHVRVPNGLSLPARVEHWLSAGELWRVKEYLEGRSATGRFDARIHRLWGRVLLAMGDVRAAGRQLYIGRSQRPEDADAISLFVESFPGPEQLFWDLPRRVRDLAPELFPRELRLQSDDGVDAGPDPWSYEPQPWAPFDLVNVMVAVGSLAVVGFLMVSMIVGSGALWRWLFG